MSIKKKILIFISLIIVITIYGAIKNKSKTENRETVVNEWFNGWTKELIAARQIYHNKLKTVPIKEITSDSEYFDINSMKELKESIEGLLEVELWKINSGIKISEKWYRKIDPLLKSSIESDKIEYLKKYIEIGLEETISFKQITNDYFNDQLYFVNFLLEKNCSLIASDEKMYTELTKKIETSSTIYNNVVNNTYKNRLKRIEEFNKEFKNENIDILLDIVPDGVRN